MQWYSAKDLEMITQKKPNLSIELFLSFVGTTRFELATPSTPCLYATGLRYVPNFFGIQPLRPSRTAAGYATGLVPKPDKFPP